jgi:hypothetical protein
MSLAIVMTLIAEGCGDDSTDGSSGNSGTQPSSCASPCTAGAQCYQPAPDSNCDGDWYCWNDSRWHCAPPESGGPGDATAVFESGGAEASDEGPVESEGSAPGER